MGQVCQNGCRPVVPTRSPTCFPSVSQDEWMQKEMEEFERYKRLGKFDNMNLWKRRVAVCQSEELDQKGTRSFFRSASGFGSPKRVPFSQGPSTVRRLGASIASSMGPGHKGTSNGSRHLVLLWFLLWVKWLSHFMLQHALQYQQLHLKLNIVCHALILPGLILISLDFFGSIKLEVTAFPSWVWQVKPTAKIWLLVPTASVQMPSKACFVLSPWPCALLGAEWQHSHTNWLALRIEVRQFLCKPKIFRGPPKKMVPAKFRWIVGAVPPGDSFLRTNLSRLFDSPSVALSRVRQQPLLQVGYHLMPWSFWPKGTARGNDEKNECSKCCVQPLVTTAHELRKLVQVHGMPTLLERWNFRCAKVVLLEEDSAHTFRELPVSSLKAPPVPAQHCATGTWED